MMLGCHIRPITHLETGKWVKTHPKQWGKMCWALLCPIQVPFQVQVGPKMGVFGVKNSQNDRMPYWAKKSTWKLQNGSKHTPSNGERCVGHFYAPSRCHSRSRLVQKWVFLGLKNSQNKQYEVPKSENLSIVWRHLSKSLVPFFFQKLIYRTPLWKPPFATSAGN